MEKIKYKAKKSAGLIWADVESNCIEHGIRGRLKHEDIEKMVAHYTDDEIHARMHGKFHHLVGIVFKNFNKKIHVIKPFRITKEDFIVVEALDPHPRNPDAVLWVAVDRKGTKFVVDELYGSYITQELAERVLNKADRYRIPLRIADPSAFIEDQHQNNPSEQTLQARLYALGLDYQKATKDRRAADRRIKDALYYEMKGEDILVAPEIYIFDTCQRLIWEIEHLVWDEWRGKITERKSPMEKPVDKDDHEIENLGRILVQEPEFIRMEVRRSSSPVKTTKGLDPFA